MDMIVQATLSASASKQAQEKLAGIAKLEADRARLIARRKGMAMQHEPQIDSNGNLLPGYRAYNGYIFTQADCDRYNARTKDVERNRGYPAGLERALNARHKTFCLITGCNG